MDLFNSKKLKALEARISALDKRVEDIEEEVMTSLSSYGRSLFDVLYVKSKPEKLTLRRKVERICGHLKIKFVTEPERTVIKPIKKEKS